MLEPALKVVPMSTVSDLAASQLNVVNIIPAFGGLVWYNAGSNWGVCTDSRARAGISSGRNPSGITKATGVLDSEDKSCLIQ